MAANDTAVLIEDGGAVEPMATGEEYVVEVRDLGSPILVKLIKVEAKKTGVGRAIRVGLLRLHQMGCPEGGHSEVVGGVLPAREPLI